MLVVQWLVDLCLTCVHKCVMQILQWQVHVPSCVLVPVRMMSKDVVAVWMKFANAQSVLKFVQLAAVANYRGKQMKITKRQLKKIIREEYSRLKLSLIHI